MNLSVVIPCFNAAGTLGDQLEALSGETWSEPWEVVIADNGSTDQSLEIAKGFEDRLPLRIVDASSRKGPAHARNVGAAHAAGEALAFCDADDVVAPGWLAAIGGALSRYDLVAGRLLCDRLNPSWAVATRGRIQDKGLVKVKFPPYLTHAAAANLGVRRALHEAINGFDESMRCLQDIDYCFRLQLRGYALHFIPEAAVNYRFRNTLGDIYRQSREYSRFRQYLYRKYQHMGQAPAQAWTNYLENWKKVVLRPLRLRIRTKRQLCRWVMLLGSQVGRTQGSIEFRVPPI